MFVARDHKQFNKAFNRLAGTQDVEYATPWHISIKNGRQYMHENNHEVGRKLALAVLNNAVSPVGSQLCVSHVISDASPQQKAALHAVARSKTQDEFDRALHLAASHRAFKNSALVALRKPDLQAARFIPHLPMQAIAEAPESENLMEVDTQPASAATESLMETDTPSTSAAAASPLRVSTVLPANRGASKVAPRKKNRREQ